MRENLEDLVKMINADLSQQCFQNIPGIEGNNPVS